MKNIEDWFAEYGESHQNLLNKRIHTVCVPAIYLSVLGMIWCLHPLLALAALTGVTIFYFTLSIKYASIMLFISMVFCWVIAAAQVSAVPVFKLSLAVFVVAWIGQFYGHKVEGTRPSFLKDLQFLLIGPLWVLKKLGI